MQVSHAPALYAPAERFIPLHGTRCACGLLLMCGLRSLPTGFARHKKLAAESGPEGL